MQSLHGVGQTTKSRVAIHSKVQEHTLTYETQKKIGRSPKKNQSVNPTRGALAPKQQQKKTGKPL